MPGSGSMKGKVVAITGGAGGIGLELGKLLAQEGAVLSIADSSSDALDKAALELGKTGAKVLATVVDVRDTDAVAKWIEDTVAACGPLDGAANLAGIFRHSGALENVSVPNFEEIMAVNVTGVLNCMRAEVAHMNKAGGSVVNAGSVASLIGTSGFCAYTASKHAVLGLTRSAAVEFGPRQIRFNCVCPGIIKTSMVADQEALLGRSLSLPGRVPMNRAGQPDEPAKLIRFLLSDDSSFITGGAQTIDGGVLCK